MIHRRVGHVETADAIAEDSHPLALETAQDRPRRARAERGRGYAGLARQRLADRRAQSAENRLDAAWFGQGALLKQKAWKELLGEAA